MNYPQDIPHFFQCIKTFYAAAAHQPLEVQLQLRLNLKLHRHRLGHRQRRLHQLLSLFLSRDHKQLLLRSAVVAGWPLPFTFSQTLIIIAGETKLLLFFFSRCRSMMRPFKCTRMATTAPIWTWSHLWPSKRRRSRVLMPGECSQRSRKGSWLQAPTADPKRRLMSPDRNELSSPHWLGVK